MEGLFIIGVAVFGVLLGSWQERNLWVSKSKTGFRKECRGKLYFVTEDKPKGGSHD